MPTGLLDYVGPFLHRFREVRFDLLHGVRTGGRERLETLDLATANDIQKRRYEGIDPKLFNRILKNLGIDYSRFVFIDLGSGKGRALMLASMFPFKKVIGLEFSRTLWEISTANLRRFRTLRPKARPVETVLTDAAVYPLPNEPTVFFFFNAFGADVMTRVLENLRLSAERNPRDILFVYVYPQEAPPLGTLLETQGFQPAVDRAWCRVYRWCRPE